MAEKPIRNPEGIKFPVIKGQLATFVMQEGKSAQTSVVKICSVKYSKADRKVYITVESGGSIYKDAPVAVQMLPNCSGDRIIEVGRALLDPGGSPIIVSEILQIVDTGGVLNVVFKNARGESYATPFILA